MVKIRPCAPADLEAVVAIRNAIQPEPINVQIQQEIDQLNDNTPSVTWTRFVAEDETGKVVGYANSGHWGWLPKDHFSVYVAVNPARRGQGAGSLLLKAAEDWALSHGAVVEFTAFMRGDDEPSFAWVTRRGWYLDLQRTESVLYLDGWNPARFAGHREKVEAAGIAFRLLRDSELTEPVLQQMYEVEAATAPDVPDYEGHMPSYEEWKADVLGWPSSKVVALGYDGERLVGQSLLLLPRIEGTAAYTGYTGVLREFRGRGIALALKLMTVEAAVASGVPRMRTNNDEENPSMLAVNAKLGYQMVPGPRRMKKKL